MNLIIIFKERDDVISKEQIENCKEAIYMYCINKRYCINCACNEPHTIHDIVIGTMRIGVLDNLFKVLDSVLHDTTPTRFRLSEAGDYLAAQGYLEIRAISALNTQFFATPKLIMEQKEKQRQTDFNGGLV